MTLDGMKLKIIWSFRFFRWTIVKATPEQTIVEGYPTYTISTPTGTF